MEIRAAGAEVVAIAADSVADNRRLVDVLGLDFPVLSDGSCAAIEAYGLLHRDAGLGGEDISRPATFLVGPDGTVRWRSLPDSWRIRVRPDDLISAVRESSSGPVAPATAPVPSAAP